MKVQEFNPGVGTLVTVKAFGQKVQANFEAFSSDHLDVLVSVSGHPVQHVGSDKLFWVPSENVIFHC